MAEKTIKLLWLIILLMLLIGLKIECALCMEHSNNTVYVIVMLPYPDPLGRESFAANYDDGHDTTPAVFLAVDQINN
jgi:hypothetical protein